MKITIIYQILSKTINGSQVIFFKNFYQNLRGLQITIQTISNQEFARNYKYNDVLNFIAMSVLLTKIVYLIFL